MPHRHSTDPAPAASTTRRNFLRTSGAVAAGTALGGLAVPSAFGARLQPDGKQVLRVGVVGCGGRGSGATQDAIDAAETSGLTIEVIANADYMKDRADKHGEEHNVPGDRRFVGPDAYKQVLEQDLDLVILATPPIFRPVHLAAAVEKGVDIFTEKPIAVDPQGCRAVMQLGEEAKKKGLHIVAGTQRRHQAAYRQQAQAIEEGAIGTIIGGLVSWCQGRLWYKERNPGESDADYLVRNWVSFIEMSGDHIAEQHVHNIDVANWYAGRYPKLARGFGGRHQRITGNQNDFFCVTYDYGDGCIIQSNSRQIDGCANMVGEHLLGSEGQVWGAKRIARNDGREVKLADFQEVGGPYVQEHIDLQNAIKNGEEINELRRVAQSTLTAIMGRIAAYTGDTVEWADVATDSGKYATVEMSPTPFDYEEGTVVAPPEGEGPKMGGSEESAAS